MTCRDLVDRIGDALAGDLPRASRSLFEGHLRGCPPCRAYLRSYVQTVDLVRQVLDSETDVAPGPILEDLIEAILDASPGGSPPEPGRSATARSRRGRRRPDR